MPLEVKVLFFDYSEEGVNKELYYNNALLVFRVRSILGFLLVPTTTISPFSYSFFQKSFIGISS